jgi:hypothetical protein
MLQLLETFFKTPVVEYLSVPSSHFFGCLQYPEIFITLRQTLFLETEVIQNQIKGSGYSISVVNIWAINCLTESAL